MINLLIVLGFAVLIRNSVTQNIGTCTVNDDGKIDWSLGLFTNEAIKDVHGLNLRFPITGNLEVETSNDQDSGAAYLEVTKDGTDLVFKTNDYFASNFEKEQRSLNPQDQITIARTITLKCDDETTTITFLQPVTDTNNNKPSFKSTSYSYTLLSPLVPKLDLSSIGDTISVEDLDFSNTGITFKVEPSDTFTIETASGYDKRTYRGLLKVDKYTTLSSQTILTVTATDNGNPALTSDPVTITIDVDSKNSIPNRPAFSAAVYRFEYSTESGTPTVTSSDGKEIKITSTDPEHIEVKTDNSDFVATYDASSATVTVEYTGTGLELTTESVLVLTLTATLNGNADDSSKTAILVDIPRDLVVTIPTFDRAYYTATYNSSTAPHTVTLDQEITVTEDATISLENEKGDSDPNFDIEYTNSKWQLKVIANLSDDVLKAGDEQILTLHASVPGFDGYATLVVKLPEVIEIKSPKFSLPLYTATYAITDGKGSVTLDDDIAATSDNQPIIITLKDSSVNFDIEKSGDKWTVKVLNDLSPEDLIAGTEYVLILEATIPGQNDVEPGYSTLTITPTEVTVPAFGKSYYTATYKVDNNDEGTVEVSDGPIEITLGNYQTEDISISLEGDYSEKFISDFDVTSSVCNINVTSKLDQNVVDQRDTIILTVKATIGDATISSLLIVTLPTVAISDVPKFSKSYYTAWYVIEDSFATLASSPILVTSSQDEELTVRFGEATENFLLEKVDHNTWVIVVRKYLSDDDLEARDLIISLEATAPGLDVGKSIVIIHLPSNCTKVFESSNYNN